jgi:Raf kinase inhibitor-like YbhB/YbcL family protein
VGHAASAAAGLIAAGLLAAGCGGGDGKPLPEAPARLGITSPAFANGGTIPKRFTCSGEGSSPPLRFSKVPAKSRKLALLVEDPDADDFLHWGVLGISPATSGFEAGTVPSGVVQLKNGFGDRGWGGPCPPEGDKPHRYVFALYALDAHVGSADDIADHALARGTLTGRFGR